MSVSVFRPWAISFLGFFAIARIAAADPVQINFDDLNPGIQGGAFFPQAGLSLASFVGGDESQVSHASIVEVAASGAATTPPNILIAGNPFFPSLWGTFFVPFTPPQLSGLQFAWTDRVAFSVIISGTWRAAIYDGAFQVLDERTGSGNGQVLFSRENPDIQYFRLFSTTPQERVAMDTLEYNTPVVPEPGTLLLFGSGLTLVLRRRAAVISKST